jgi:hypothetical protein
MINLPTAEYIVSLVLLIFVYLTSTTINGYIQASVALKLGDSTPEESGFLTLNPLAHMDVFGFLLLLVTHLGWGKFIPFNYEHVHGKHRMSRIFIMYSMETIVSVILALLALVVAVIWYGPRIVSLLGSLFLYENVPLQQSTLVYSDRSSFAIVMALLLLAYVFFNVFIAALSLILNGFRFALAIGFERGYKYIEYADYLTVLAPLLVIFLFANVLRYFLLHLIMWLAFKIAFVFGVQL